MSSTTWVRWLPAAAIPALIAGGVYASSAQAAELPDATPEEVIALALSNDVSAFSGTVEQSTDLGLPALPTVPSSPGSADAGAASFLELLSGEHTANVWVDEASGSARMQVLDTLAERNAIVNGTDAWFYDSSEQTATHATLPEHDADDGTTPPSLDPLEPTETPKTPEDLAREFLASADESTDVTLGDDTNVAGRDAYTLVMTPRTDETLVGSVVIAVDGETGFPLAVDVFARGQEAPAIHVALTKLTLETPSPDVFAFTPPPGTTVTEATPPAEAGKPATDDAERPEPVVTGSGWASIVELPAGSVPTDMTASPLLDQLSTPVTSGRAITTSLVSVLITPDGRAFAGAVPVEALEAAATAPAQ